jgi:hypothetical protein
MKAGKLHHFWDTEFVRQLGSDPVKVAKALIAKITQADVARWSQGTPTDWAQESFAVSRDHAYALLPVPTATGSYKLQPSYVADAKMVVASQLSKAGVRLASVLNEAL